jgi:hypothetical protein
LGLSIPLNSIYTGAEAVQLSNGRNGTSTAHSTQLSLGYNGTNTYQHHIATNHDSTTLANNKIEFYVNDGVSSSTLPATGCRRAFALFPEGTGSTAKVYGKSECDSIETTLGQAKFKQPYIANDFAVECANIHIRTDMGFNSATSSGVLAIDGSIDYKGYSGMGSWNRLMCGMALGEAFIDTTKVLKMEVRMYRLSTVSSTPEHYLRADESGGHTTALIGFGESSPGNANNSNPAAITVNHSSTDMNNTSHNNAAIHKVRYGTSGSDFTNVNNGENSCVIGRGYLYKKATGANPFEGIVKLGTKTLWQVGTKSDDDFRLTINGELIQVYEYANIENSSNNALAYKYSVFEMNGDWALIEYKNMNGSGGAYVNLVFQCLGVVS